MKKANVVMDFGSGPVHFTVVEEHGVLNATCHSCNQTVQIGEEFPNCGRYLSSLLVQQFVEGKFSTEQVTRNAA